MLNNILNKRNYSKSNIIKKCLRTLIIGIGIIFNSNNSVYATANIEEAKDVTGGTITIDSEKITYKYDGTEKKEVNNSDGHSIKLSQETLHALFGESKTGNLRFDYFVSNKRITETEDLNALVNKNVFLTGTNTGIEFNETVNFINQQIHLFAMIGINSMAYEFLFGSYNRSTEIINADNVLIAGNRLYTYLFYNYYNFTLILNGTNISIESNKVTSTEAWRAFLVYNRGTTTIGSETTDTLNIKKNEINGKNNTCLFYNNYEFTLTLNGTNISIESNKVTSTGVNTSLVENLGTTTIGSETTDTLNIKGNEINGKNNTYLFYNSYNSTLTLNGTNISIESNKVIPTGVSTSLVDNHGTTTISSETTSILNIKRNEINGKNDASLFHNDHGSTLNLKGKDISIESNKVISIENWTSLVYNHGTTTIGSETTSILNIKKNGINGKNNTFLFYNNYHDSTLNLKGKDISIESNKVTSTEYWTYLVYNKGTTTIGSETTSTLNIKENEINGKNNIYLFYNDDNSTLNLKGKDISIESNKVASTGVNTSLVLNKATTTIGSEATDTLNIKKNGINGKNNTFLFYNNYHDSTLNLKGKDISIESNKVTSIEDWTSLVLNRKTTTIGSEITSTLNIKGNEIEGKKNTYLFHNDDESTLTLNGTNISIGSNKVISIGGWFYFTSIEDWTSLVYNKGTTTIGSETTSILNIKGNEINGEENTYLFYNNDNSTLTLNGTNISIESNKVTSTEKDTFLVYNLGTTTIGSKTTDTLNIKKNEISGKRDAYLFHNDDESTLTLNGNKIAITNNTISPTFYFNGRNEDKYSVAFFNREGIININLNEGDNPSFELLDNNMAGNGKGIIGIAMINDSQLNFINNYDNITNNHDNIATVTLGHDIKSFYYDNKVKKYHKPTVNFKGSSFLIKNKNISTIEANKINFESNATLLVGVFSNRITRLTGIGEESNLSISDNIKLTIDVDENNLNSVEFDYIYTIASGFTTIAAEDRFRLIDKTIKYNGEDIDVIIRYNNDKTITALFKKKEESQSEQNTVAKPVIIEEDEEIRQNEDERVERINNPPVIQLQQQLPISQPMGIGEYEYEEEEEEEEEEDTYDIEEDTSINTEQSTRSSNRNYGGFFAKFFRWGK